MTRDLEVVIRDPVSGEIIARCYGPLRDGGCAAVDAGAEVACAGLTVAPANADGTPYPVPAGSTACPVTWALALAASPDAVPE